MILVKSVFDNNTNACSSPSCRRFGTKCGGCSQGISPNDLVRRARSKVFHLNCFTCMMCNKQLSTGEELYIIDENKFVCKDDYLNNTSVKDTNLLSGTEGPLRVCVCVFVWARGGINCDGCDVFSPAVASSFPWPGLRRHSDSRMQQKTQSIVSWSSCSHMCHIFSSSLSFPLTAVQIMIFIWACNVNLLNIVP